jgi:hypothetical protein
MNTSSLARCILTLVLSLPVALTAFSQSPQTNASILAGLPWAETYNREVDLIHPLLNQTNKNFDQKVCRSLSTNASNPVVISYQLVSFTFYYPTGVAFAASSTEMASPYELVCTKDGILRRDSTNKIPANYIRVSDAQRKSVEAELDLLLGVAQLQRPQDIRYFRRSFRFAYQNGWKED